MKITIDKDADAMYIYLRKFKKAFRTEMVTDDTIVDLDRKGKVVGIELLWISQRTAPKSLDSLKISRIS